MSSSPTPNLRFDIDALVAHLKRLGPDPTTNERDWHFSFRSSDFPTLERLADSLAGEFTEFHLQEEVETIENGRTFMGPPLLAVVVRAALPLEKLKALADRFAALARNTAGVTYDGVSSYELSDEQDMFGWLDPEAAVWRLRHLTDSGLKPGVLLPFVFALSAWDLDPLQAAATALQDLGYDIVDIGPDDIEPGRSILIARCPGRNDEALLERCYKQVETATHGLLVEVLGAQFFEDDDDYPGCEEDGNA